ncbi:DNA polymerase III subunit gamma and tau [Cellulomonas sp. SLBN-39]|uniref:DNA polymerase III subunit gamma and tau n=1 Tax=Cellulomonas sp. SLBN-39 TaxID=2768446 RepID=UPI0011521776|nr:DNA polymerase III subunit gamma and tau [Cellulomonas sp. SLBN-39]TQL02808.1 DNA polymerase-3 subunit gamma/tau [Cellulomonas sp. SLBN-39]
MTTALYRRYRPESFAEVIGQDHVTAPLRQALRSGQSNHAYLFSGPRGCGKTTSARILARCLNCAQGPTDTPCGECASCVELARGGPGSLDVVEIDAASHGGVDDARELRERATFAPARDRYKVFILDEAHMVSPQGFNALLKIVEEPPPHVKFVFATTEPDKVIGTIRSRTHHYPFRLVPPDVLLPYLEELCATEGVQVGSGVLSLVVRAGSGSVRDTLSVLDQLIAGAGPDGLDYEGAVALLGYTHTSLLDDLVDAVSARDGGAAFRVVERVITTGHEPRRFVEDLLERLRDLIVIAASGEAAGAVLRDLPPDQLERMRAQATHLGASELSRSADLANAALTEMVGATSPRLHLELLMARLLLPAVDDSRTGLGARVDRLERGLAGGAVAVPVASAAPVTAAVPSVDHDAPSGARPEPTVARPEPVAPARTAPAPVATAGPARTAEAPRPEVPADPPTAAPAAAVTPEPGTPAPVPATRPERPAAEAPRAADPQPEPAPVAPPVAPAPPSGGAGAAAADTEMLRRRWPEVLTTVRRLRLPSWALVNQHAQILELDATTLRLGFAQPGLVSTFRNSGHGEVVARALHETLGVQARVEAVLAGPAAPAREQAGTAAVPDVPATITPERAAASWDLPAGAGDTAPPSPRGATSDAAEPAPPTSAPGPRAPEPDGAAPEDGPSGAAAPTGASGRSTAQAPVAAPTADPGPVPVAAPDDDIPPGDEPEDPWSTAPSPRHQAPARTARPADRPAPATAPAAGAGSTGAAPTTARERGMAAAARAAQQRPAVPSEPDEPSPDDPLISSSGLIGVPLVVQALGGRVVEEIVDGA